MQPVSTSQNARERSSKDAARNIATFACTTFYSIRLSSLAFPEAPSSYCWRRLRNSKGTTTATLISPGAASQNVAGSVRERLIAQSASFCRRVFLCAPGMVARTDALSTPSPGRRWTLATRHISRSGRPLLLPMNGEKLAPIRALICSQNRSSQSSNRSLSSMTNPIMRSVGRFSCRSLLPNQHTFLGIPMGRTN